MGAYTAVTVSGYNTNPPADDGSQVADNQVEWQKHLDKIGGPLKTAFESMQTNLATAFATIEAAQLNFLAGLTLSNNGSDAANDIDIAAGAARDTTNSDTMKLTAGLTKRTDAAWAVGTGNGGLDTGSVGNNTYHVWLIKRSDTGVVDVLFSLSVTAPTMPTNYDLKRRIGSIVRVSAAINPFVQTGDRFRLKTPVVDMNTSITTSTSNHALGSIPTGIAAIARLTMKAFHASTLVSVYVRTPGDTDSDPATFLSIITNVVGLNICGYLEVRTDTSSQVATRSTASSTTLVLITLGWVDPMHTGV